MKKSTLTLVASAIVAAGLSLASCSGNKTAEADQAEETTEAVEEMSDAPTLYDVTGAQLISLADAKFIGNNIDKPVFIDFNATWCGPCRQFAPYFEAAAEKYADRATFIAVDIDKYGEIANAFGIESIPTMIAVTPNGKYVKYVGITDLVGDGAFDGIVEKVLLIK